MCAQLEQRLDGILDIVEGVDAGRINMPPSARTIAFNAAKKTHSWCSDKPPTSDIAKEIEQLDVLMSHIVQKIQQ